MLVDTHFHLDFIPSVDRRCHFLKRMHERDIQVVAQTLTPSSFKPLHDDHSDQCSVAIGFHPWWIEDERQVRQELQVFERDLSFTHYVGEIGLDFNPKLLKRVPKDLQIHCLRTLFQCIHRHACSHQQRVVLSIHAVRSADTVLDLIEEADFPKDLVIPILHWFSGSGQALTRHRRMGGYFSINSRMLQTKKGRSYVQQIEADQLLLETDLPNEELVMNDKDSLDDLADQVQADLLQTVKQLSDLRQEDMRSQILDNQERVFGC